MQRNRVWEIDFLRFLAILFMVTFHLIYDLREFGNVNVQYEYGFWRVVGATSAILFMIVSGISSGFSKANYKRGLKVLAFGMLVTIATYFFDSSSYVRFGILHFLGVSMLLFEPLKKLNNWVLGILGIGFYILGKYIEGITINTFFLIPFGICYRGFQSIDYYPLFPYIAFYILGILIYKMYYYKRKSLFKFQLNIGVYEFVSRHSLSIYIIHQPILIGMVYLYRFIK